MWGAIASAAISSLQGYYNNLGYDDPPVLLYNEQSAMDMESKKEATTAKCPCCGSRQFVSHQSRRVCSYCRSEQDGQPVRASEPEQIDYGQKLACLNLGHYRRKFNNSLGHWPSMSELSLYVASEP